MAAALGKLNMIGILVEKGADVSLATNDGTGWHKSWVISLAVRRDSAAHCSRSRPLGRVRCAHQSRRKAQYVRPIAILSYLVRLAVSAPHTNFFLDDQ